MARARSLVCEVALSMELKKSKKALEAHLLTVGEGGEGIYIYISGALDICACAPCSGLTYQAISYNNIN